MIKKHIFSCLLLVFIIGVPIFPQNQTPVDNTTTKTALNQDELSSIEKRFKSIDESIVYLKKKNVDINDIITMYADAENMLKELKYNSELKDYYMTLRYLADKLSIIDEKTSERLTLAKRMNLIYILMVGMGLSIVLIMGLYSIYMYLGRK